MLEKYVSVIDDHEALKELGFVETVFHNYEAVLVENVFKRISIVLASDYVYLKFIDMSEKNPYTNQDLIVLWNRDLAGVIPIEKLKLLVELIEEGNVKQK